MRFRLSEPMTPLCGTQLEPHCSRTIALLVTIFRRVPKCFEQRLLASPYLSRLLSLQLSPPERIFVKILLGISTKSAQEIQI